MANIRIRDLANTASSPASDDFLALDGLANGTRKMSASSPSFGSVTVSDVILGTNGPSVESSLSARAPRQALVFDGTAGANVTNIPAFGTGDFTFAAWVNQPTLGAAYLCSETAAPDAAFLYLVGDGTFQWWSNTAARATSSAGAFVANKWMLLVAARTGGTVTLYADGISVGSGADTQNITAAIDRIGMRANGASILNGSVLPIVYNRALPAAEIKALYERGAPAAADYGATAASNTALNSSSFVNISYSTFSGASATGFTAANAANTTQYAKSAPVFSVRAGNKIRVSCTVTLTSGQAPFVVLAEAGVANYSAATQLSAGSNVVELVATGANSNVVAQFYTTAISSYSISAADVKMLGLLLAPDAAQTGGGLTWYDTSGNAANITLPASGVSWNVPFSGNVTSGGQLNLRAGGTNRDITLAPTGNGTVYTVCAAGEVGSGIIFGLPFVGGFNAGHTAYNKLVINPSTDPVLFGTGTDSGNGKLQLATHTTSFGGIGFGTDISLYRSAANTLAVNTTGNAAVLNVRENGTLTAAIGTVTGDLYLQTQQAGKKVYIKTASAATAVTFDENQNSIFAGNVAVQGSVNSDGVNGNALFGGAKRVIIGYDTTADVGNIGAVHTGTAWKALALQPVSGAVLIGKTSDTGNGRLQFVEGTTAQNGIQFGTDTNLYRSAANTLKTDDIFQAAQGVSSGTYLGGQDLYLNNAAGTVRAVYWQTAGASRWAMYANTTAESGSNAGTNWVLSRYSDAGAYLGDALSINRATGAVSLEGNLSLTNTATQVIFGQTGAAYTYTIRPIQAGGAIQIKQDPATINRWLALGGSDNSGNFSERMRIVNAGNILFGTTTDSGQLVQIGTNTTANTGGIGFGTDVTLYRSAADTLKTDDSFQIQRDINQEFFAFNAANANTGTSALVTASVSNGAYGAGFTMGGQNFTNTSFLRGNRLALTGPFDINYVSGQHYFWIGGGGAGTSTAGSQLVFSLGPGGKISHIPISYSTASWLTNGVLAEFNGATLTNNSTAASSTVASAVAYSFAAPAFAATNASVTTTNAATLYVAGNPVASSNQTFTNTWGIWNVGRTKLGGFVRIDDASTSTNKDTGCLVVEGGIGVEENVNVGGFYGLADGIAAPGAATGYARIYVDTADGDLKVIFGDGTIKTIATDS